MFPLVQRTLREHSSSLAVDVGSSQAHFTTCVDTAGSVVAAAAFFGVGSSLLDSVDLLTALLSVAFVRGPRC